MKILDIGVISVESLRERKFRFALNLLGIMIGCAAVTGLISLTQGMNNEITSQMGILGTSTITIIPGTRISSMMESSEEGGFMGRPSGGSAMPFSTSQLDWRDVDILEKIHGIDLVVPRVSGGQGTYIRKGVTFSVSVDGITDRYFEINEADDIIVGRELIRSDKAVVIIGYSLAYPLDGEEQYLDVGDRIKLTTVVNKEEKTLSLRIVGILEESGSSFGGGDESFMIPIRTYEQFFETGGEYTTIQVKALDPDSIDQLSDEIEDALEDVSVITSDAAMSMVDSIIGTVEAVLSGIAGISLLVAGVGIINTMTVSVMERTREIGVLKAIGARSSDVLVMFLSEAVMTGMAGGTMGAVFGFMLSTFVGDYVGVTAEISLSLGAITLLFAVITCVVSGLYPAWRASNLNPV
ncbi:MAG TPA: ABC transporter permease, partial [Patescibacteria group bacterium]|nr:ABC transporter permease [Patescibacteria group bacterium]